MVPTSPRAKRISGSKNFRSPSQKDFCNNIEGKADKGRALADAANDSAATSRDVASGRSLVGSKPVANAHEWSIHAVENDR
jgi:hypothetical protein